MRIITVKVICGGEGFGKGMSISIAKRYFCELQQPARSTSDCIEHPDTIFSSSKTEVRKPKREAVNDNDNTRVIF